MRDEPRVSTLPGGPAERIEVIVHYSDGGRFQRSFRSVEDAVAFLGGG